MKNIKYILSGLVTLAAALYFYLNYQKLQLLTHISILDAVVLVIFVFLSFIVLSLQFYYVMRIFKIRLKFKEFFGLTICNTMFNYYLPARGGLVVRALYLKKKYGFYYSHYTSLIAGTYLVTFNITALFGLLVSVLLYIFGFKNQIKMILIFAPLLVLTLSGTAFTLFVIRKNRYFAGGKIGSFINSVKSGLMHFRRHGRLVQNIVWINLLFILTMSLRLYWSFKSLGIDVNFFQITSVRALANFSMVLSLTPANLGVREGIIGFSAGLLGVDLPDALLAAALDRLVGMVFTFIVGLYFSRYLLQDIDWRKKAKNIKV